MMTKPRLPKPSPLLPEVPRSLRLQERQVPVVCHINRRLKQVRIQVQAEKIVIKSPVTHGLAELLEEQRVWINKAYGNLQQDLPEQVLYLGQMHPLQYQADCSCSVTWIEARAQALWIHTQMEPAPTLIRQALDRFFLAQGRDYLYARLSDWSVHLGLTPARVRFKRLKSRWGSCSAKNNINLNYRMIQLPPECIDAILVHELAHLVHLNHGPDFWALVHQYIPDYRQRDQEIKRLTPFIL